MKQFKKKIFKKSFKSNSVAKDAVAMDAFTNAAARMGFDTPSVAEGAEYTLERWTLNYWLMVTLFRNHWLARRIVERPAMDMCKSWCRLNTELDPKLIKKFDRTIARTFTPSRIQKALKWGNLFGGAGALIVIDGHEDILDRPLDLDTVSPGSYKGLITFDRWSGIYPGTTIASDINNPSDFGMPEYYTVTGENTESFQVHHSRILRFNGPDVPWPEIAANSYWGISKLEIVYEELRKRDNMSWSILNLLFRAQILTQKNPELAQLLSGASMSSPAAMTRFAQSMQAQNELLSNQSMLILGEEGELQSHQYSFGGISEVYSQFQLDVAGAAEMPVTLLFGRTATGLGQTNDADVRNYEQYIAQKQNDEIKPNLDKLYPVVCMSEFGETPDDLDFSFPSVRVLTEEEKSNLAKTVGETIVSFYGAGLISQKTALEEAQQLGDKTDIFTNLDDDIAKATTDFNQPLEMEAEGNKFEEAPTKEGE
jgi:phage-related protein (TIGR01555 family)